MYGEKEENGNYFLNKLLCYNNGKWWLILEISLVIVVKEWGYSYDSDRFLRDFGEWNGWIVISV